MRQSGSRNSGSRLKQTGWFVLLWLGGVAGAMLLALPFRLLVAAASVH